jgi:uncharacterized Zn-finger protein
VNKFLSVQEFCTCDSGDYYECEVCHSRYKTLRGMDFHRLKMHEVTKSYDGTPIAVFECDKCAKKFSSTTGRNKHMLSVHQRIVGSMKQYDCPICELPFSNKFNMERHCFAHHGIRKRGSGKIFPDFKCELCMQTFKQKANLTKHVRIHHCVR